MYDIEEAFAAIEEELIASMIRNLERHSAWEEKEGFQWEQWQALQLQSLEQYKRRNKKRFTKKFDNINKHIETAIREARERGGFEQEIKILEAIKTGKFTARGKKGANAEFFKINDRKIDALIKATVNDMQKAETAILRMANDKYRQVIFNAQVYANSGAGTYEKAVDMATKDFLSSGLNCVEYKNGARHTLKDYADMALRTASKRAYLTGEGEKRAEWGIHTVIVNKRGNPCPKCLPFVGRVFIDDVWSGGSSKDGKYPLLSSAVEAGLYHPRCKDSHTTFFPGITPKPVTYNKAELKQLEDRYINEQKQKIAVNNVSKYKRLAKYSLDPENKSIYKAKAKKANVVIDTLDDKIENEALEWYVSGEGQWVNQYLRGSSDFGELSVDEKELIAAIDKATSRETVTESKLFRSVDAEAVFGDMSQIEYENLRSALAYGANNKYEQLALENAMKVKGRTITEKGFMSTSKDYDVVADWGTFTGAEKPIIIEFDVPEGIKGKDLKAFDIEGDEQFEVLLARNSRYEIKDITAKDGNIYLKAELKTEKAIKNTAQAEKVVEEVKKPAFTPAKTIEEAKKYAEEKLGLFRADYDKMQLDFANMINKEVTKVYDTFGNLNAKGRLESIIIWPKRVSWYAAYSSGGKCIGLKNVTSKGVMKKWAKDAAEQYAAGFWSTNNAEHAIRHELGHAVQHMIADDNLGRLNRVQLLHKRLMRELDIDSWSANQFDDDKLKQAGKYISYYALRNENELIAESVAEYMAGNPRLVAKKVIEILTSDNVDFDLDEIMREIL